MLSGLVGRRLPDVPDDPTLALVQAAQAGDQAGIDALITEYLPLVYNIVGRALDGHADVDDVVQETMLRVVDRLHQLRDPAQFRSWLVSVAMRQVRERYRTLSARRRREETTEEEPYGVADPGADFVDLTIMELGLAEQRRETVEATRWLDAEDRQLLSLWWLEVAGQITRPELAAALDLAPATAAVQVQRLKARLETAREVVHALATHPRCPQLAQVVAHWDGRPSPLWRKRVARHVRDCRTCGNRTGGLVSADRLLVGIGLVPPTAALAGAIGKSLAGAHPASVAAAAGSSKLVALVTATAIVATGGGAAVITIQQRDHPHATAPAALAPPVAATRAPAPTSTPAPSRKPSGPDFTTRIPAIPDVVSDRVLPDLTQNADVDARDYARSVGIDGASTWIFNDTTLKDPWGFMSNSGARTTDLDASDGIRVTTANPGPGGSRTQPLIGSSGAEAAYEATHDAPGCTPAADPYCGMKFGFWPTGVVADPARHRVLFSYDKVCRSPNSGTPCGAPSGKTIGSGMAALDVRTGKVTRLDAGGALTSLEGTDSRLTFAPGAAYGLDVVVDGQVYGEHCPPVGDFGADGPSSIARAPLDDVQTPSSWHRMKGQGPVCGSGNTVQWVPALKAYLNTYLPSLGDTAMYQVGGSPFGPWSKPRPLAGTAATSGRVNYALAAHPEYAKDGGLVQYLTYQHPDDSSTHLLRVVLKP